MKIKKLTLFTTQLSEQRHFYRHVLGFPLLEESKTSFSVQVGWTRLVFQQSSKAHLYHYCFLIPVNKLHQALSWMESRTVLLPTVDQEKIFFFENWNAHSFYFYDGAGNILECIARHDLQNTSDGKEFGTKDLLCVNEIGIPTNDIPATYQQIKQSLGVDVWRGDWDRFQTCGTQEGLFLLPDYTVKETWFPTDFKTVAHPFSAVIENQDKDYHFDFTDGNIVNINFTNY